MLDLLHGSMHFFIIHGIWGLFLLAFLETSFFPVPADIVLVIFGLMKPHCVLWYALVATIGSSLGGIFGYIIGINARMPILLRWISKKRIARIERLFEKYGGWALMVAGFAPISYIAGLFKLNWIVFSITFTAGRAIKFAIEAILIIALGEKASELIRNHHKEITTLTTAIITGTVIITYLLVKYIKNRRQKKQN
ncbi:MAG: VTT domain-containing protein [Syntrophomonas sp.]